MKNLYTTIILMGFIGLFFNVNAQVYSCVRNISTNPINPFNTEWNQMYQSEVGSFINNASQGGFSWYYGAPLIRIDNLNQSWSLPPDFPDEQVMFWPFDISNGLTHLYQVPGDENDRDFHWEDGWELLWMNLGILPDGTKIQDVVIDPIGTNRADRLRWPEQELGGPRPGSAPYFVLYNRYSGLMRVFFNVWLLGQHYDDVTLTLKFMDGSGTSKTLSGAFRLLSGLDQFLDQPTEIIQMKSPRFKRDDYGTWYVAEFQIAYDPCQCYTASEMEFAWGATDTYNVDLKSRNVTITQELDKIGEDGKQFFQTDDDVPGTVIYKYVNDLLADYKTALDKYETELNDYNSFGNQGKKLVLELLEAGLGVGINGMVNAFENMSASDKEEIKKTLKENDLSVYSKVGETPSGNPNESTEAKEKKKKESEFGKEVTKAGKKVLANQFDYMSAILGIQAKPQKPQMPTAMLSEGIIQGKITSIDNAWAPGLLVPGTMPTAYNGQPKNIRHHNFPAYNNVMGMFALMKTPELLFYKGFGAFKDDVESTTTNYESDGFSKPYRTQWTGSITKEEKIIFMVPNGLTYSINPALDWDLEKTSFLVSFQIEIENEELSFGFTQQNEIPLSFSPSTNSEVLHIFPLSNNNEIKVISTDYYNINDIKNKLFSINNTRSWHIATDNIRTHTNNSFEVNSEIQIRLNAISSVINSEIKSIKMKIIADMYFDQIGYFQPDPNDPSWQGEQVNTFQVRTFELYNKNKPGSIEEQLRGEIVEEYQSWANYIPGTTVLNSEIAHNDPRVKEVDATTNTIIIRAEHVEVTGPVKPAAGYNLRIEAMKEIKVLEGGKLLPNVVAKIVPDFYGNGSNPPATSAQVATFCTGQNPVYGANNPGKRAQELIDANERERQLRAEKAKMSATIYPNPTTNYVQVSVKNQPQGVANLQFALFDITGRQVLQTEQEANSQGQYTLQLPQLSGGIYMLHIKAGQQTSVEKVVIK